MEKENKAKSKVAKIINIATITLLSLCAAILVYTTISYSANGFVNFFGYSFHVIQSESMEPEIKVGDLVVVKSVPYDQIQIGDDILFKCEDTTSQVYGKYVVHRVKEYTETEGVYITYGINNGGIADNVPSKAQGKAISVNSTFGAVFSFMTNWRSVIIAIALLGLLGFTIMQVCSVVVNASKLKAEKAKEKLENDEQLKEQLKNEILQEMKQQNNTDDNSNDVLQTIDDSMTDEQKPLAKQDNMQDESGGEDK